MKIKSIRLKDGYKRFQDLTISLGDEPARIVALVGPNGSGKSSVFDGILFKVGSYRSIGSGNVGRADYHSMDQSNLVDHTHIEIELDQGDFQSVFRAKQNEGRSTTVFSFRSPYRFNSSLKISETRSSPDIAENNYGASLSNAIDARMEENYRRLHAKFNRYRDSNDVRPSEAREHIIGKLNTSIRKCLNLEVTSLGNIEDDKGTLFFSKPDQSTEFEFNVLSSGEKEVVDLLLDLFLREEKYDDTVFLIDEPELHINTAIQKNLLIEVDRLVGENCQIWVASHSIGLMRALQTDFKDKSQVIYFDPSHNFGSESVTLSPIRPSVEMWKEIFATALDDLSDLVSPRQIIYCEGKDRPGRDGAERGFDAKVYNQIFGAEFPETLFVSSGGHTELDQRSDIAIKILSKAISDLEVLVLKDRDFHPSRRATSADRTDYLAEHPENHRMLSRFEIENYLYDKEIVHKYCSARGVEFDEPAYDALLADVINDDAKSLCADMIGLCGHHQGYNGERFRFGLAQMITSDTRLYAELRSDIFDG